MGLLLTAVDILGLRWRWQLSDGESGVILANHEVDLTASAASLAMFGELYGYARSYAAPDRRVSDEARIVAQAGDWARRVLLGAEITGAIADAAPVTVRVLMPSAATADELPLWPLELAHQGGTPLAARGDISFVYDLAPAVSPRAKPAGDGPLRILAVFSQPTKTSVLALRRERYALARMIRRSAARGRALELRIVQYGVTRKRLTEIAGDGDGWDVLHLSGHGGTGEFLLEKHDGAPDSVATAELVALLRPAKRRVTLTVVSACESAADETAQTYRLLGLTEQAEAIEAASPLATPASPPAEPAVETPAGNAPGGATGAATAAAAARAPARVQSLAQTLATELDCAVVGMRYPVADEFAIGFAREFYERLLSQGQAVDEAAAAALAAVYGESPSAATPAVSLATPVILGARAVGLRLRIPPVRPDLDTANVQMDGFPPEPARFVGRAETMARASAALAPGSPATAVLLHGMAGAGKTACALELAYRHQDAFGATAFWRAPTTADDDWGDALPSLAAALEIQLGRYGFQMSPYITTVKSLEEFLPRLRRLLETSGILLVLDNLETLLTPQGHWRDPRWSPLIAALTDHDGESRVILTSRIVPLALAPRRTLNLPVHALSLDESVALARELPNLGALLHADTSSERPASASASASAPDHNCAGPATGPGSGAGPRSGVGPGLSAGPRSDAGPGPQGVSAVANAAADRERVRRVLRVVQGHPKLMELADAAAADRDRLDIQLAAAEVAADRESVWSGAADLGERTGAASGLDAFFRDGTSSLDPEQFLDALTEWTTGALQVLPEDTRLMAEFVACLEDSDRLSVVINDNWADLWRRLARPGDAPEPGPLLDALAAAALIEAAAVPVPNAGGQVGESAAVAGGSGGGPSTAEGPAGMAGSGTGPDPVAYTASRPVLVVHRVHPGVAAAIMAAADPVVREAADAELAAFWAMVSDNAREREGGEDGELVVRAGLAAAPYLLRRGDWATACFLLEQATMRDVAPGTVQAALPSLRRIADATGLPADAGVLARVLRMVDPAGAERLLREATDAAAEAGDFQVASAGAGELANLLQDAGRLVEALAVVGQKAEYTRRAGLGPWTQLLDQGQRLQVLGLLGEHARVLAETEGLRAAMAALPARRGPGESADPWNVRELILGTGRSSALATGEWDRCLELNAEVVASMRGRGAGAHEVAMFRFNDAGPLVRLGRLAEAGRLLAKCQRVFEDHADTGPVAQVLSARASLESALGRLEAAADLQRSALRLAYARPEPRGIAVSHHNLASYLGVLGGDRAGQRAHRLAAALIRRLSGSAHYLADTVRVLAAESGVDGGDPSLPATVTQVVQEAERTEGVRLGALLAAMQPDPRALEDALAEILSTAVSTPPPPNDRPGPSTL